MEQFFRDLRDVFRSLRRHPGFAGTVVLTLALGIGANTAVFSLVNGVLVSPLPYPESDRLVTLWFLTQTPAGPNRGRNSEATYTVYKNYNETFAALGLASPVSVTYNDGERPVRIDAATVTPPMFEVLDVVPVMGRAMVPEDGLPGAEPVVVLSDAFWATHYGRAEDVLDSRIEIDGVRRRAIGVLPPSVRFPEAGTQVWIPQTIDPVDPVPLTFFYTGYARLKPGVTIEMAQRDAERLLPLLPEVYPQFFPPQVISQVSPLLVPLRDELVGDVASVLWILFGAAGVVLLIATANVANLFLVRFDSRKQELAVRRALGASKPRMMRHIMTESCILAAFGGTLGVAFANGLLIMLRRLGPDSIPRLHEVTINTPALLFTGSVAVLVGLLFGLASAMRAHGFALASTLRSGARNVGLSRAGVRLRSTLVVGQVALAMIVLTSSGLMLRSFWSLRNVNPGFTPENLLALRVSLPAENYGDWSRVGTFYRQLLDGARGIPGVDAAAAVTFLPLRDGRVFRTWDIEGVTIDPGQLPGAYLSKVVSDEYFETMRIPIFSGRGFRASDHRNTENPPVVVSAEFANRSWPNKDPLGKRMQAEEGGRWYTVVGVVGDVRDRTLTDEPEGLVYLPMLETNLGAGLNWRTMSLAIRTGGGNNVTESIRDQLFRLDPALPAYDVRTMVQVVADATGRTRFTMVLLAVAAGAALFLGAIGLYGVLAYLVGQRRNEIGVRMALGASASSVRGMVVRQAIALAVSGAGIGVLGAFGATRVLETILYGVSPTDPTTYVVVTVLLLGVAWLAASFPARRASRVDPVTALSQE